LDLAAGCARRVRRREVGVSGANVARERLARLVAERLVRAPVPLDAERHGWKKLRGGAAIERRKKRANVNGHAFFLSREDFIKEIK